MQQSIHTASVKTNSTPACMLQAFALCTGSFVPQPNLPARIFVLRLLAAELLNLVQL
jgi:hypothetical protein